MSFATNDRRRFDPEAPVPRVRRPAGLGLVVRMALLATLGIIGATWALVRHYTRDFAPMLTPAGAPAAAPTYDADAGEVPVPEIEPAP